MVCSLSLCVREHDGLDHLIWIPPMMITVMVVDDHCAPLLPWRPKSGHNSGPLGIVTETTPFSHLLARGLGSPAFSVRVLREPTARSLIARVLSEKYIAIHMLSNCAQHIKFLTQHIIVFHSLDNIWKNLDNV